MMGEYFKFEMLLFVMIFGSVLCTVRGQEDKIVISISSTSISELRKNAEICGKQYGVDPGAMRSVMAGSIPKDKTHKQFLHCLCFTSGYVEEDGHYKIDKMLELTPVNGTRESYKKNIENCNKTTRENYLETMYEMVKCFHRYYIPIIKTAEAS